MDIIFHVGFSIFHISLSGFSWVINMGYRKPRRDSYGRMPLVEHIEGKMRKFFLTLFA